jgi:hypothetical protein
VVSAERFHHGRERRRHALGHVRSLRSGLRITPEIVAVNTAAPLPPEMLIGCRGEALTRWFWGARLRVAVDTKHFLSGDGCALTPSAVRFGVPVGCDTLPASGG